MAQIINLFQTITKHSASMVQPPSVITSLVHVLNYIKEHIDAEASSELSGSIMEHLAPIANGNLTFDEETAIIFARYFEEIIGTTPYTHTAPVFLTVNPDAGNYPHYINMSMISSKVIDSVYNGLVTAGHYSGTREDLTLWLLATIGYYDVGDVRVDNLETGITLGLALMELDIHNTTETTHSNGIKLVVENWFEVNAPVAFFTCNSSATYNFRAFRQVDRDVHELLITRTDNELLTYPPLDPVLNYNEFDDLAAGIVNEAQAQAAGVVGYTDSFMLDYEGEVNEVFNKKMDYYSNHLDYVLSTTMDPAYVVTMTNLRQNTNSFYSKVFDLYTKLYQGSFSIITSVNINRFTDTNTLDLLNLTGLSKSLFNLSVQPYMDSLTQYNRLICSFDNFNPDFTETLIDGIEDGDDIDVTVLINFTEEEFVVYWAINDLYSVTNFTNTARRFHTEPRYLFVPPKVTYPAKDTIRLSNLEVYNTSVNHDQALFLIEGFKNRT